MGVKQEPVPIRGNAGGLGAWGSGLNKASRQSPHQSRRLYLRGCEGGAVKGMPVTARVGISPGGFKGAWREDAGVLLQMLGAQVPEGRMMWGASLPPIVLLHPHPVLVGSKLSRRPLTPGLHNFQGMSQISEFSGRHPQTSHRHIAA